MKLINEIKQHPVIWWISAFQAVLGGIVAGSMRPTDPWHGSWWFLGWAFSFPANLISFAFRYTGDINCIGISIIQLLLLIPIFKLLVLITSSIKDLFKPN